MSNVINFPAGELDIKVKLERAEKHFNDFEERIESLAEILDLNIQGLYHVLDVEPDEVMMSLLHLSAMWAVRGGVEPEEYMDLVRSIHLEVAEDAK